MGAVGLRQAANQEDHEASRFRVELGLQELHLLGDLLRVEHQRVDAEHREQPGKTSPEAHRTRRPPR